MQSYELFFNLQNIFGKFLKNSETSLDYLLLIAGNHLDYVDSLGEVGADLLAVNVGREEFHSVDVIYLYGVSVAGYADVSALKASYAEAGSNNLVN